MNLIIILQWKLQHELVKTLLKRIKNKMLKTNLDKHQSSYSSSIFSLLLKLSPPSSKRSTKVLSRQNQRGFWSENLWFLLFALPPIFASLGNCIYNTREEACVWRSWRRKLFDTNMGGFFFIISRQFFLISFSYVFCFDTSFWVLETNWHTTHMNTNI